MKNIFKLITLSIIILLSISACSSKVKTSKIQKTKQINTKIDTKKINDAYKELDNELQKNK